MQSVTLASLVLVPLYLLSAHARVRSAHTTGQVEINAKCAGPNTTSVTVSPWNLTIAQGDDVEWRLNANANSDEITIIPKKATWPYRSLPPYKGSKADAARATQMKGNAKGRYSYNVILVCTSGNSSDTVTVDPDIIIN